MVTLGTIALLDRGADIDRAIMAGQLYTGHVDGHH
jgi:hypothetical protein